MKSHSGFTLIELAIVLVIVTILVGGLAVPLSAQIEARRIGETRKTMEEAREAVIGYAMSHTVARTCNCSYITDGSYSQSGVTPCPDPYCPQTHAPGTITLPLTRHHLPCPDLNGADPEPNIDNDGVDGLIDINNGVEDRRTVTPTVCATTFGNLPWVTLATAAQDAWGNRLRYIVSLAYADADPADINAGFNNTDTGDKQICNTSAGGCAIGTVARDVPIVLISHGPNGWGARSVNNTNQAAPASNDEIENTNLNDAYVSRPPSQIGAAGGEFDDVVVWLSSPLLFSRVCPAGGCP